MSVSMTEAMISLSDEKASAERRADLAKPSLQAEPAGKSYRQESRDWCSKANASEIHSEVSKEFRCCHHSRYLKSSQNSPTLASRKSTFALAFSQ